MKSVLFVVLAAVLCLSAGVRAEDASYTDTDVSLAEVAAETSANEAAVAAAQSSTETQQQMAADIAAHLQADAQVAEQAAASTETETEAQAQAQGMSEAAAAAEAEVEMEMEGPAPLARLTRRNRGAAAPRRPKRRPIVAPAPIMQRVKFHPERVEAQTTNRFEDPEMGKLNLALDAVKEDILSTNKQINDERKWVIAVAKIIASYNEKMKRVEAHIVALRKEMKALYRKKKQIENLKLQKALEAKLKEAREELSVLTNSLKHVAVKQGELNKSGADLRQTIAGIQSQLAKLRGQQLRKPRPAAKGKRRGRRGGVRRGKGRKGGKRCKKGFRFSRKLRKCVKGKKRAGRR